MRCSNCNCVLSGRPQLFNRRVVNVDDLYVIVENVPIHECPKCKKELFLPNYDELFHIKRAILRELADFPATLDSRQINWAARYLVRYLDKDEKLARWLGFSNISFLKKWNLSFDDAFKNSDLWEERAKGFDSGLFMKEARHLLATKVGFSSNEEMIKAEFIPPAVDEKMRKAMRKSVDQGRFLSRTEYLNDKYVIFVDLQHKPQLLLPKSTKPAKKEDDDMKRIFNNINAMLATAGHRRITWTELLDLLEDENTKLFTLYDAQKNKEIAFACTIFKYHASGSTLSVSNLVVDKDFLKDKEIILEIINRVLKYALKKNAIGVALKPPRQTQVEAAVVEAGFVRLKADLYIFVFN